MSGDEDVEVGHGGLSALGVDDVASEDEYLVVEGEGGCGQATGDSRHGTLFDPLAGVEVEFVGVVGDGVPGFLRADAHEGEDFRAAGVVGDGDGVV